MVKLFPSELQNALTTIPGGSSNGRTAVSGTVSGGSNPSPPASTTQIQYPGGAGIIKKAPRIVTPVAWMEAPQWLTVHQACRLSGWDRPSMLEIVREGTRMSTPRARLIRTASTISSNAWPWCCTGMTEVQVA